MSYTLFCDGCSKENTGPSGADENNNEIQALDVYKNLQIVNKSWNNKYINFIISHAA